MGRARVGSRRAPGRGGCASRRRELETWVGLLGVGGRDHRDSGCSSAMRKGAGGSLGTQQEDQACIPEGLGRREGLHPRGRLEAADRPTRWLG